MGDAPKPKPGEAEKTANDVKFVEKNKALENERVTYDPAKSAPRPDGE